MATPGPQPSSMTRSVGWTSRSCTAQRLRATFDERRPMIQPATCPTAPVGWWQALTQAHQAHRHASWALWSAGVGILVSLVALLAG
jgi:hypothetical protein